MALPYQFRHHFVCTDLPLHNGFGDYGQAVLVDLDRDGQLEFVCGSRTGPPEMRRLYWFKQITPGQWQKHIVGRDSLSDVGACALDVTGNGWPDIVTGGTWFENPGESIGQKEFARHVFDPAGGAAHDTVAVDLDGDGRMEIVTLCGGTDAASRKDKLVWYKIPADPKQPWTKHIVGDGIHGALTPLGIADIAGNGHLDIVRGDTWFENIRGDASEWIAHANIPFGNEGPYGMCVRTWIGDIDGDGRAEIVMTDADYVGSRIAILRHTNGRDWTREDLPQSFLYGSLHSLAVADFSGTGRLDILVNEQEELLPPGRENPRWVIWENRGGGEFVEHIILDQKLGGHDLLVGDVRGRGRIDIVSKIWGPMPWNALGGKMHIDYLENIGQVTK